MQIPSSWRVCLDSSAVGASRKGPGAKATIRASAIARTPAKTLRWRRVWDTNCDGKCTSNFNLCAYGVTDSRQLLRPSLPSTGPGPTVDTFEAGFAVLTFQVSICSHGIGPCVHSSSAPLETQSSHRLDQLSHQSHSPRWFRPDPILPRFAAKSASSSITARPTSSSPPCPLKPFLLYPFPPLPSLPSPSKLCVVSTSFSSSYVRTVTLPLRLWSLPFLSPHWEHPR